MRACSSQTVEYALRARGHLASLGGVAATAAIANATQFPGTATCPRSPSTWSAPPGAVNRGRRGGSSLRPAAGISILDIVNAVDPIHRAEYCPSTTRCIVRLCAAPVPRRCTQAQIEHFPKVTLGSVLETSEKPGCCQTLFSVSIPPKDGAVPMTHGGGRT